MAQGNLSASSRLRGGDVLSTRLRIIEKYERRAAAIWSAENRAGTNSDGAR